MQIAAACVNELSLANEWLRIVPWGDWPHPLGAQRVRREDGERMVQNFRSLRGRLARMFRGVPIFAGHPDIEPDRYPDRRRYGKIVDLDARDDGLYGRVEWNALGSEAIEQGYYLYVSPAWTVKKEGDYLRPTALVSVGLTNTPNIPGDPWAKNDNDPHQGETQMESVKHILIGAGLADLADDEPKILAAVNELIAAKRELDQAKAELTALQNERDQIKAKISEMTQQLAAANERAKELRRQRIEREVELAVNAGRITEAEKPQWAARLEQDFDANIKVLNELQPKLNTTDQTKGLGSRKGESNLDRLTLINEAVRKVMQEQGVGYDAAYRYVKRTQPALFETQS